MRPKEVAKPQRLYLLNKETINVGRTDMRKEFGLGAES